MNISNFLDWYPTEIIILRLVCLIIGYLVIKLGYNLVVSGIKGDFKFSSQYKGIKGGLVSSSPGLLFVLLGAIIVISGIYIDRPFDVKGGTSSINGSKNHAVVLNGDTIPGSEVKINANIKP